MNAAPKAAPGWYPNSDAREQWWDGAAWTQNTREKPPVPPTGTPVQAASFWRGSKDGSLIVGILATLLTFPFGIVTFLSISSGPMFILMGFWWLFLVFAAVMMFLNYRGLSKQEAAARTVQTPPAAQPPAAQ